ncbi:MAG: cytochrome c maturation protein CcmE [Gammaproteobacteria bacterium]
MTRRYQRLVMVLLMLGCVSLAVGFALRAFNGDLLYYITPTQLYEGHAPVRGQFRLGGIVEKGSVTRIPGSMTVRFTLTDFKHTVPVVYTGILPDLFRVGQGIVVRGRMVSGIFQATQVLAKHGAKYMPPGIHQPHPSPNEEKMLALKRDLGEGTKP